MPDQKKQEDRITAYLSVLNQSMLFDELSDDALRKLNVYDEIHGVPIPLTMDVIEDMTSLTIALGMARIIGGDPTFRYRDAYLSYIKKVCRDEAVKVLVSEGAKAADGGSFELACMYFRAALLIDPKSADALYLYGRACKGAYETNSEDEAYVGSFKAESLEAFEILTIMHPDHAMGHYFLGYGYLNLGLYSKAAITWRSFMKLSEQPGSVPAGTEAELAELRDEISERIDMLEEPVNIEDACNRVLKGDFAGALEILEQYKEGRYSDWWPLWYYMAVAETGLGNVETAIADYRKALTFSPSNIEIMQELINIYEAVGDRENAEKYSRKIEIVTANMEAEKEQEE